LCFALNLFMMFVCLCCGFEQEQTCAFVYRDPRRFTNYKTSKPDTPLLQSLRTYTNTNERQQVTCSSAPEHCIGCATCNCWANCIHDWKPSMHGMWQKQMAEVHLL
jgi:hypothetical protein